MTSAARPVYISKFSPMKAHFLPWHLLILLMISTLLWQGCGEDEIADLALTPSLQCGGAVTGVEGLYWDISNGFARGDIPNAPPTIVHPGGQFIHPTLPLLGFFYPAGWTPQAINSPLEQAIGVNLFRNDNAAIYRYLSYSVAGLVSVDDIFNFELNGMMATFGLSGTVDFVCTNQGSDNSTGLQINGRSAFVRVGGHTAIIATNTTYVPGLSNTFVNVQVTAAPTGQYATEVLDTFLPIGWQLLYNPNNGGVLEDRDGDGVPDIRDDFPDDPTRW